MSYLRYDVFVWFVFTFSCLQEGSCLIYVICVCLVCLYRRAHVLFTLCVFVRPSYKQLEVRQTHVLFMLRVFVWFVFTNSCLQEGSCLIYVMCVCLVCLYLQLFVGGLMSYLHNVCLFGLSLQTVVCRRAHVLFTLRVFVWFVFTNSCLQEANHVLFTHNVCLTWFVFTFNCLQEDSCLIYVMCVCLVCLYLQLFVGGLMSYLRYVCLFGLSLPPVVCRRAHVLFTLCVFDGLSLQTVVCRRAHVLFTLCVFVRFVFTFSCLQEGSCLIYVMCVCLVRLYLQLFVGGLMSYLRYVCLFGSSLPPVVCRRAHVLFTLCVFVWFVFTFSCLQEGSCLIYVMCVCSVCLYLQLFVGGLMSYLRYVCLFGSSLPPVVCRRAHVLFTLCVFVRFVFTFSCLQEGSCLIYIICVCLVRLYLQLFVGGLMSYLRYVCLFGLSLPSVVCRRAHVLFTLCVFVWFVFTSSCLQEGSCLIYVMCVCLVCLYLQLFVGGLMSYLRYVCLLVHSGVQHICVVFFVLFVFILYFVYPMLLIFLDCSFLIAPSVFFNV